MKTTLRYLSLNAQATWHRQVEEQLKFLHSLTAITAAEVVLEHQRETKLQLSAISGRWTHAQARRRA